MVFFVSQGKILGCFFLTSVGLGHEMFFRSGKKNFLGQQNNFKEVW
jgi:hypothetical protein